MGFDTLGALSPIYNKDNSAVYLFIFPVQLATFKKGLRLREGLQV